jgi:hypothetical protein
MRQQNRDVVLLIDNFSGHFIDYEPKNIELVYFTPNITAYIQPLDAGVIRCYKANHKRLFCEQALDLDDAGETEIYKINLVEAMRISVQGWDMVTPETIQNCWRHTGIVPEEAPIGGYAEPPSLTMTGWNIIETFAASEMSLPEAERALVAALKDEYHDEDWRPALRMVTETEPDEIGQLSDRLAELRRHTSTGSSIITQAPQAHCSPSSTELVQKEQQNQEVRLMEKVQELKNRRLIFNVPTVADLLDNPEERLIGESKYTFEDDQAIIDRVQREAENLGSPESGDESDDDEMEVDEETPTEIIELCRRMEKVGMSSTDKYGAELAVLARKFRAELTKDMMRGAKQTTLDAWTTKTMRKENGKE